MEAKIKIEGHGGQLLYSLRRNAKILWCPTNLIVEWFVVGKRAKRATCAHAGTRRDARARARERRKLAASKRGKWGGIRTEHKAAKRATRSRVALAVSCGGVFDVDGGNEMSLARGGEHHTARASRVISAFHRGDRAWRGKHLGRRSRGRSKAETKEGKRGLLLVL